MRDRDTRELKRPEYLHGKLKFYWVDTGTVEGVVVVKVDVDAIVDCPSYWKDDFIGRTLREVVGWGKDTRVTRLSADEVEEIPEAMMCSGNLGNYHLHRCRSCRRERACVDSPPSICTNGLCRRCHTKR